MVMGVITRDKKRRMEEEERLANRISSLPDGVLGDIVSLLPTKAGARTQVLSSRWRRMWRSAPLNIDLHLHDSERRIHVDQIPRVLSAHPGPGRRFSIPRTISTAPTIAWIAGSSPQRWRISRSST